MAQEAARALEGRERAPEPAPVIAETLRIDMRRAHHGAHAFAHFPFTRDELGCDYYATSLHKWLFAPHGTGMLYVKRELIAADYVYSLKRHYDPKLKSGNLYLLENAKVLGLSELRRELITRRRRRTCRSRRPRAARPNRASTSTRSGSRSTRWSRAPRRSSGATRRRKRVARSS